VTPPPERETANAQGCRRKQDGGGATNEACREGHGGKKASQRSRLARASGLPAPRAFHLAGGSHRRGGVTNERLPPCPHLGAARARDLLGTPAAVAHLCGSGTPVWQWHTCVAVAYLQCWERGRAPPPRCRRMFWKRAPPPQCRRMFWGAPPSPQCRRMFWGRAPPCTRTSITVLCLGQRLVACGLWPVASRWGDCWQHPGREGAPICALHNPPAAGFQEGDSALS